ncbi:hypothetical protein Q8F55_003222 [Vanrija albida]|uniref:Zn(2)-C6 fungal-type domain-containing protein n=1 Tax=Vanrija albida TaxID=181172 RepID=A0ABR3QBV7_9TREE
MSPSPPPNGEPSDAGKKKRRVAAACEACRLRKLACDARQPCARCENDKRACEYVERRPREILSKARVQELEDVIRLQGQLWDAVLPDYPMSVAQGVAATAGLHEAVLQAKRVLKGRETSYTSSAQSPSSRLNTRTALPTTNLPTPLPHRPPPPPYYTAKHHAQLDDYAPDTYEWSEDQGEADNPHVHPATEHAGSHPNHTASYLGLSSSATFMRAVRHLAAKGNDELLLAYDANVHAPPLPSEGTPGSAVTSADDYQLPKWSAIRQYVDDFFRFFHRSLPLCHEPTIRAQLTGAVPFPTKPGSITLVNMIIALGAFSSSNNEDKNVGYKYFLVAKNALQRDMFGKGTLPLVQGLALMSNYLQHGNRPEDGYMCLGWALRMAVALGLHIEPTSSKLTPLEKEMRIRTWWSVISIESGVSVTFGRPHAFSAATFASMPLPINCDDDDLTVSHTQAPEDMPYVTQNTALIMQARLARSCIAVWDHVGSCPAQEPPSAAELRSLEQLIANDFDALLPTLRDWTTGPFQYQRASQVWRSRDFRALLFRPLLLGAAWDSKAFSELSHDEQLAISACRSLAMENLTEIGAFVASDAEHTRAAEWYAVFFAFQSVLSLLLSVIWEPTHPSADLWRRTVLSTAGWFRELHTLGRLGNSYASIIDRILELADIARESVPSSAAGPSLGFTPSSDQVPDSTNPAPNLSAVTAVDLQRYWSEIWGDASLDQSGFGSFLSQDFLNNEDLARAGGADAGFGFNLDFLGSTN